MTWLDDWPTVLAFAAMTAMAAVLLIRLAAVFGWLPFARIAPRLGLGRQRPPRRYVRALFDGYADHYDQHLLVELRYAGANLVSEALNQALRTHPQPIARALDLGCGTGSLGVLLRGRVGHLSGLDLSAEMLDQARRRGVYDALFQGDLLAPLPDRDQGYDLLTAADVLVYVGGLGPLLGLLAGALRPDGLLIFTTEALDRPGFRLLPTGRFAHHPDHVAECAVASGLRLEAQRGATLRYQNEVPVPGHVHTLRRHVEA